MNNTPQTPPNNEPEPEPEPELENITTNILKPDDWAIPFLEAYTGHNKNAKAYGIISKAAKRSGVCGCKAASSCMQCCVPSFTYSKRKKCQTSVVVPTVLLRPPRESRCSIATVGGIP